MFAFGRVLVRGELLEALGKPETVIVEEHGAARVLGVAGGCNGAVHD